MITDKNDECIDAFPHTYVFDICKTNRNCHHTTETRTLKSGVVVLILAVYTASNKEKKYDLQLDQGIITKVRSCKPNIILGASYNHYESHGECYAFGNRAHYRTVDNSSVSIFVNKKSTSKNPNKQITIDKHAKEVEDICASVIYNAVTSLSNVLTEITG